MDLRGSGGGSPAKRRVMIVADPGREAAAALEWALSHAVLAGDEVLLLHVNPPAAAAAGGGPSSSSSSSSSSRRSNSGGGSSSSFSAFLRRPPSMSEESGGGAGAGGEGEASFLEVMRAACEARQPRVRVQVERVEMAAEGKDGKAQTILAESRRRGVELLVIGQRRSSSSFLGIRSGSSSSKGPDPADFLIENSKCLCVGVQKKGQNAGYLLNTKTHKNFWLLA